MYPIGILMLLGFKITTNGLRAGDRSPVLRLRQGYGACALLWAGAFRILIISIRHKHNYLMSILCLNQVMSNC